MKKLLFLPLLVLLTGCVTYYYPETALEDGVYYAQDDPSYVVHSGGYPGVSYYPWVSIDYFYMGYYPYYRFGYYSPWYSYYPYYPVWRPYRGYCGGHRGCGRDWYGNPYIDGRNRYAGIDEYDRPDEYDRSDEDLAEKHQNADARKSGAGGQIVSSRRYVTTAPAGYSGEQGMVIRNGGDSKVSNKSRIEPVKSTSAPSVPMHSVNATRSSSRSSAQSRPRSATRSSGRSRSHSTVSRSSSKSGRSVRHENRK